MQIRERKKFSGKLEFLRAVWDADAKRSRQKLIKPEEFTADERAQYEQFIAERKASVEEQAMASRASYAHDTIMRLAEAVEAGHGPDDPAKLLAALDRLNKALRKAGVKRPARVAAPARDTKTADLLSNQPAS